MASLDTNVLVRWLVDDDPAQSETVRRLMDGAAVRGEALFIPSTVLLELEWVLRKNYDQSKLDVLRMLNALLDSRELVFENEAAIERKASRLSGAELLS
jgi:predicted nucleic-acid-binding protein